MECIMVVKAVTTQHLNIILLVLTRDSSNATKQYASRLHTAPILLPPQQSQQ